MAAYGDCEVRFSSDTWRGPLSRLGESPEQKSRPRAAGLSAEPSTHNAGQMRCTAVYSSPVVAAQRRERGNEPGAVGGGPGPWRRCERSTGWQGTDTCHSGISRSWAWSPRSGWVCGRRAWSGTGAREARGWALRGPSGFVRCRGYTPH